MMVKMKKTKKSKSVSATDFVYDFDPDISIALEYTGSPLPNLTSLPKVIPLDVHHIPTAKPAPPSSSFSLGFYNHVSLPVVQPLVYTNNRTTLQTKTETKTKTNNILTDDTHSGEICELFEDHDCLPKTGPHIQSSDSLGFSNSSQDHSRDFSASSDMLETPVHIQGLPNYNYNYITPHDDDHHQPSSSAVICYADEEESDGEHLECRRTKNKHEVTFCDEDSNEIVYQDESVYTDEGIYRERPVPQRPSKKGMCYHCHKGNRFTDKEACLVCDAKFCARCILRTMGSMPQGRKCLTCLDYPIDDSKRYLLGRCSRLLKRLLKDEEVKQIMNNEISCASNQLPSHCLSVNGRPLRMEELMTLRSCSNPPRNLKPGNYWYDKVSGFWGKEGQRPCQIITPRLIVGNPKMKPDASNGNTNVLINGREITKAELWMLQSAGVQCDGNVSYWVQADGTYQEEGMDMEKGKIWGRKRTKILCALLSLPTLESPNPRSWSDHVSDGKFPSYLEHRSFCKVLLLGSDRSGTSTIYKQARVLYDVPFSEEERQDIKSMIQINLYGYLGRLLEGREQLEEESSSVGKDGPSDENHQGKNDFSLGPKLKAFSDWLINVMVSGNLEIIFPAATRENALYVEELWKDASIQATFNRRDEFGLPRAASYFLDRAVEIARVDYEPSDTDILYAEGVTSSNGVKSMEFLFPQTTIDGYNEPAEQPDPTTWCQLTRVHEKSLGEKCKWLEMFEDTNIVLFSVSLTEYNEYETHSNGEVQNRMLQTKKLFESIVTHPSFQETNFLLILNKFDLLEEMIEEVPLSTCEWFEDFNPVYSRHQSSRSSGNNIAPLAQRAFHYIAIKFKKLFKSLTEGRKLYVCPVTGLERDTVDTALKYAKEIVKWEEDKLSFSLNESSSESIEVNSTSYS